MPGWRLKIEATSETYSDVGNYIGRLEEATEQLDRFDNPEPPYIDGHISLAMEHPVSTLAEKSDKMGSRLGRMDRRKIEQNPYRIRFFQGFPRREHC